MTNLKCCLVTLIAVLASTPVHAQTACVNPPSGMVAWWTGDNTTTDFLGLSNGSTSSPVSFGTGEVDAAFNLGGSQYLQIPNNPTQLESSTTAISLDAWVKASAPGLFKYLFAKGASSDGASYALYTGGGGGAVFYISDGTTFFLSPPGSSAIWDGNWHHFAGTYDSVTVRLFVDGQEVDGGTAAPSVNIAYGLPVRDAYIGTFAPLPELSFVGAIDEVTLFNRALTPTEIQAIYNAGPAGKCKVVSPIATAARGMGYWQNKNGQAVIAYSASTLGVCNLGSWLRQYAPFRDLSASANCREVANYALNTIKAANASGTALNAMLKAQMLTTALDVYFSDPAVGGNALVAPHPIGGVAIDISGFSSAFGSTTSLTVSQMLAYASGESDDGGGVWYGNLKSVQELAKNAFAAVNNATAFAPH